MTANTFLTATKTEKAILVGVDYKSDDHFPIDSSMEELALLARAAGAKVVGLIKQKLDSPSPIFYLGKGKLTELLDKKEQYSYTVAIFNDELNPRQQRNLEDALNVKVIDRTALILDIFARRAQTREGKLQVELAQHQYILPRLAGQWSHLERLGGGIGTRGPGESQLETDRRMIRTRIQRLKAKIEAVRKHRALYRQKRKRANIPIVALVGYTNAGKSTLLNALSKANVPVANKPFSTLDPVTKQINLNNKKKFLLTDTVGFIHKLPTSIVASFRATLEELEEADLLINVVDITIDEAIEQNQTVEKILKELSLSQKPRITVLNKIDLSVNSQDELISIINKLNLPETNVVVPVSALQNWGLDNLLNRVSSYLYPDNKNEINDEQYPEAVNKN